MRLAGRQAADFRKGNDVYNCGDRQNPKVSFHGLINSEAENKSNKQIRDNRAKEFHVGECNRRRLKFK